MYVIFPAEEVIDLYLGIGPHDPRGPPGNAAAAPAPSAGTRPLSAPGGLLPPQPPTTACSPQQPPPPFAQAPFAANAVTVDSAAQPFTGGGSSNSKTRGVKERERKVSKGGKKAAAAAASVMAAGGETALRELTHPSLNESLKQHNAVSFKLVRTVSDFTQQLSQVYEQHAEELQLLVANFRKRNAELRKERPTCPSALFHTWETLLQEVEVDSQAHSDIASVLGRQVSRPLLERTFHRKIQSRKVFTHRESYETILTKTEEKLAKCRQEYKTAYLSYLGSPSTVTLSAYLDTHNEYVAQLHATNGMLERYHIEALPHLLQELEDVYSDLCSTLSESLVQGAEVISSRAIEQSRRYDGLATQCRAVAGPPDLAHLVRSLPQPPPGPIRPAMRHNFAPPHPPPPPELPEGADPDAQMAHLNDVTAHPPPPLKNEIVVDRLASVSARGRYEALRKEAQDLEAQIKQLQDALDTMLRIQQRSLESQLFNKANELQEDISLKRFDLQIAQIHLGAVRSQKELFGAKADAATDAVRERKMSSSSTGSMKNKWLKAFKSLKTPPAGNGGGGGGGGGATGGGGGGGGGTPGARDADKKNQMYHAVSTIMSMRRNGREREMSQQPVDAAAHQFQEYTYKKITPCDACSQVLRGHTRQGLKCRNCKLNVHVDCQDKLGRCQPKSRLLRRQKSTSEIETRLPDPPEEESRSPGSGIGTRPFGHPLCLSESINENGCDTPTTPTTPTKSKTNRFSK